MRFIVTKWFGYPSVKDTETGMVAAFQTHNVASDMAGRFNTGRANPAHWSFVTP